MTRRYRWSGRLVWGRFCSWGGGYWRQPPEWSGNHLVSWGASTGHDSPRSSPQACRGLCGCFWAGGLEPFAETGAGRGMALAAAPRGPGSLPCRPSWTPVAAWDRRHPGKNVAPVHRLSMNNDVMVEASHAANRVTGAARTERTSSALYFNWFLLPPWRPLASQRFLSGRSASTVRARA